jgi:hypothetical protein
MVMDEGTYDYSVWAFDMANVMSGRYPDDRRVAHASSSVSASISPNGTRLLMRRIVPTGGGHSQRRYTVMPFAGGSEVPVGGAGLPAFVFWTDSVTVGVETQTPTGLRLAEIDVRTNAQRNTMDLPDSEVSDADALSDGWVWIPAAGDRIIIRQGGRTREVARPPWYAFVYQVRVDRDRHRVFYDGPNKSTGDSLGVGVLTLDDDKMTQWASMFSERGEVTPLADGTALLKVSETEDNISFFKLRGPGQVQSLGVSPRPVRDVTVSADLKRATAFERDYRADAWMNQVVRQ